MAEVFKVGDRVKLDPNGAGGWLQPLRKFAVEGRAATVTAVHDFPLKGIVRVLFDKRRKTARDVQENVRARNLILIDRAAD